MTSTIAKTWTIGGCAFALLAFTNAAQAQGGYSVGAGSGVVYQPWPFPWPIIPQLPACTGVGQPLTLSLNTGSAAPLGTADPIWTVAPGGNAYSMVPVPGAWFANTPPRAYWIQPAAGGAPRSFAQGTYVYKTQFVTPAHPYFYRSISIAGTFGADDEAIMKLNDVEIARCSAPCFQSKRTILPGASGNWRNFTQTPTGRPWSTGYLNTLTVEVKNTPWWNSPSGLFVRAAVTAVCSKCTSPVPNVPQCGGNPSTC